MSPAEILSDLEARLGALGGGPRLSPARHRTVRATVEWSYELLEPAEQAAFRSSGRVRGRLRRRGRDGGGARAHGGRVRPPRRQVGRRHWRDLAGPDALPAARDRARVRPRVAGGERRARAGPRASPALLLRAVAVHRPELAAVCHPGAPGRAPARITRTSVRRSSGRPTPTRAPDCACSPRRASSSKISGRPTAGASRSCCSSAARRATVAGSRSSSPPGSWRW